jgi:hypothetical protein
VAQVALAAGAAAAREPAPRHPAGLADACLVLEPDLDRPAGMLGGDPSDQARELFLKSLLGLEIGLGVDGARLLPGEVEVVEQPQHAVLAVGHAEALGHQPAQILGAKGADPVALARRAAQHERAQRRQLAVVEPHRAPPARPVA